MNPARDNGPEGSRVRRRWVDSDRDGGWWPATALAAVLVALLGVGLAVFGPAGLGDTLLTEAVAAAAAALAATAVVGWRRARIDQPDVQLPAGPAAGVAVELVGLGRSWPEVDTEALAELRRSREDGGEEGHEEIVAARLYRCTRTRAHQMPVVVAHRPGPDEPGTPMRRASRAARRARRLALRETSGGDGQPGRAGRVLMLEHRAGTVDDLDPYDQEGDRSDDQGDGQSGPGLVPAVVVRLFDRDEGRAVAGAHAYRRGDLDDWVIPAARHTLRLRAEHTHELTARGRPTRRTFIDADGAGYVVRSRRRPKRWEFTAPPTLDPDAVLLCAWLVHLLDVHVLLGRVWEPDGPVWRPVEETFPVRVGPGGFGDAHLPPAHSQNGGGGS